MDIKEGYYRAIMEQCGSTRKEIDELVQEKKEELKGLISTEGALYILSKEFGIELTSKKIKNGGKTKMSEEKKTNWLEDLAILDVGGNYVPSAEGLIVTFKLIDHTEEPNEVQKTFEGKPAGIKKQWKVTVHGLSFNKKLYKDLLADKNPDKLEMINDFQKGKETILELSKTASKQLAIFMLEKKITSNDLIKYLRTGDSFDTEYQFKKAGKTEGD